MDSDKTERRWVRIQKDLLKRTQERPKLLDDILESLENDAFVDADDLTSD